VDFFFFTISPPHPASTTEHQEERAAGEAAGKAKMEFANPLAANSSE
jgi:hypothetical protein